MEFFINQKLFNVWGDKYTIKDENDNDVFEIRTNVNALKRLTIYDMADNPLLKLKKRYWRFLPRWDILDANDNLLYVVKRKFVPFVPRYKITGKSGVNEGQIFNIQGNIIAFSFSLMDKEDNIRASVSKKFFKLADSYSIDVSAPDDVMLAIGVTLIFDLIHHRKRNTFASGSSSANSIFKIFRR